MLENNYVAEDEKNIHFIYTDELTGEKLIVRIFKVGENICLTEEEILTTCKIAFG